MERNMSGVIGKTRNGVLARRLFRLCKAESSLKSDWTKSQLYMVCNNLIEANKCFIWAYPTVTDMSSENATKVSTSAGTAVLLKFVQNSKKVLI